MLVAPKSDCLRNPRTQCDRLPEHKKLDRNWKSSVIFFLLYFWGCQIQSPGLCYVLSEKATKVMEYLVNVLLPELEKCGGSIQELDLPDINLAIQSYLPSCTSCPSQIWFLRFAAYLIYHENQSAIKSVLHLSTALDFMITLMPELPNLFPGISREQLLIKISRAKNAKPMLQRGFTCLFHALNSNTIGTK